MVPPRPRSIGRVLPCPRASASGPLPRWTSKAGKPWNTQGPAPLLAMDSRASRCSVCGFFFRTVSVQRRPLVVQLACSSVIRAEPQPVRARPAAAVKVSAAATTARCEGRRTVPPVRSGQISSPLRKDFTPPGLPLRPSLLPNAACAGRSPPYAHHPRIRLREPPRTPRRRQPAVPVGQFAGSSAQRVQPRMPQAPPPHHRDR